MRKSIAWALIFIASLAVSAESVPDSPLILSPLLLGSAGEEIKAPEAWAKQRELIRERWLEFIGDFPTNRAPLKSQVLVTEKLSGFTREHVKYQIEDGVWTEAYLLSPTNVRGKLPAVVVFHPTTGFDARGVAGLEATYPDEKQQGVQLVQRGYVILCPRNFIFDKGTNIAAYKLATTEMQKRHPNWTGMARMTFDAMRAADYLESLPQVDSKRIGCIGHSLGAKVALYAGAFDQRYRVVVFSEGGIGLKMSNWEADWYLGSKFPKRPSGIEHHELIALIAPRAFLLLAGDSADSGWSRAYIEAIGPVYKLFNASGSIRFFDHHLGHRYPPEARDAAEKFLDSHLKR